MKTHHEIWNAHLEAFEKGIITVDGESPKFATAGDLYESLQKGEIVLCPSGNGTSDCHIAVSACYPLWQ